MNWSRLVFLRILIRFKEKEDKLWLETEKLFHFTRTASQGMQTYFTDHMYEVARDNLKGTCTKKHSCLKSFRKQLLDIMGDAN